MLQTAVLKGSSNIVGRIVLLLCTSNLTLDLNERSAKCGDDECERKSKLSGQMRGGETFVSDCECKGVLYSEGAYVGLH